MTGGRADNHEIFHYDAQTGSFHQLTSTTDKQL
jgi:hypothetical protein